MENKTMMIDYYELTMSQAYFNANKHKEQAYFDVFFRTNPFEGGYGVMGGLDEIIEYIKNFKFSDEDIQYLRERKIYNKENKILWAVSGLKLNRIGLSRCLYMTLHLIISYKGTKNVVYYISWYEPSSNKMITFDTLR